MSKTPIHQWTHKGSRVLLVKCVDQDGKGYGGFQWPKSGAVKPAKCSTSQDCDSGGLFGWSWGLNLGGGKGPDYLGCWIVFSAAPSQVIDIGDKQKAAANTPDEVDAVVEYYGDWHGAMAFTLEGRLAWIEHKTNGSPELSDCESGSSSATGLRGSASATGWRGSASATGERGSASATGLSGSASATGWSGSASATGERGSASATGLSGSASATGWSGSASATGLRGSASATGLRGSASATGERGSASATGWSCVAAVSGDFGTIEIGPKAAGVCTSDEFTWISRKGAVLLCRWFGDVPGHKLLMGDNYDDGAVLSVRFGEVTETRGRQT